MENTHNMNGWEPIENAPEQDYGLFGYMDQFGNWAWEKFHGRHEPIMYGFTHWFKLPMPIALLNQELVS